ncbi:MAG: MBL fold metallo-hydrolase [Firmicutes bacterium]|nr:MBL fold metallo-hydrolase [Bacillota bacterium]
MSYYTVKKIYPWLYSIFDPQHVYCYLIAGEKTALLYDTAYGIGCLDEAVRTVCDLPYEVVLSHGHIDHVNGASQFEEVWIHSDDVNLCLQHSSDEFRRGIAESPTVPAGFDKDKFIAAGAGNFKMLEDGKIFDLGGLTVEVVPMEGHTGGSIGLLIREHKVLLDSDAANHHIWMFLEESLEINAYISMLKRVKELDFDTFFVGHSDAERPKSDFEKFIAVAENIDIEKSTPYEVMPELSGHVYTEGDVSIVFIPKKL